MTDRSEHGSPAPGGKVARLIREYDLDGLGDELAASWTAEEDRMSLRDLAVYVNETLLRSALEDRGVETLTGEVENLYRLLTDDDVTSGVRTQAENRLEEHGIDVEALRDDFVSRQAVHTYLTSHRDIEHRSDQRDGDVVDRRMNELRRLRSRQSAVTERTLSTLRDGDHITLGDYQTLVSVRVQCNDCGKQYDVQELVDRGGCDCSE